LSEENSGEQEVWRALVQKKFNIFDGVPHENEGLAIGGRILLKCKPDDKFVVM
jgi:hypothetical protein